MPEHSSSSSGLLQNFSVLYKFGVILLIWGFRYIVEAVRSSGPTTVLQDTVDNVTGSNITTLVLTVTVLVLLAAWLLPRTTGESDEVGSQFFVQL